SSPVKLEFNALGVRLSSSSPDLGGAVEVVKAEYEGEDITVAFNPGYLVDGLSASVGERVHLEVRDGLKPAIVKGEGEAFVDLAMPVRLPAPVGQSRRRAAALDRGEGLSQSPGRLPRAST